MNAEVVSARDPKAGLVVYATLCAIGVAAVFLTNWPVYSFDILGGPPPIWYFLIACILIVPIVFADLASVTRLVKAPICWWFAAYVVLGLLWLLGSQDFIEDGSRLWRLRLIQFFFFCAVMILCMHAQRHALALVILACVVLAAAFNWFDLMRPFRFVPQGIEGSNPGRGAGMFINANAAAEIVVVGVIAVLPFIPMRFRAVVLVMMVVGVAPTLSRGGLILAAMVLIGAIVSRLLNRVQCAVLLIAVPLLVLAAVISFDRLAAAADSPLERTIARLVQFEGEGDGYSTEARKWAAAQARDMIFERPILGSGIGATTREAVGEGPHNMYLMLAAEQGLFGLALYVSLIGMLGWSGWKLSRAGHTVEAQDVGKVMVLYAGYYVVGGVFSHNILEAPYGIFVLGFLGVAAMQSVRGQLGSWQRAAIPERLRWRSSIPSEQDAAARVARGRAPSDAQEQN